MAKWDYWHTQIFAHVPGAPNPLIAQELRLAAREFFRRTRAWVEWLDPTVTTGLSNSTYEFALPADSELYATEKATQDGRPYPIESFRQLSSDPLLFGADHERGLVSRNLQTFALTGRNPASGNVQVQVILIPSNTATGIPDHLASRFGEALAEGAKAKLMLVPNTTFTNTGLAAVANAKFEQAIDTARVQAYLGHNKTVPRNRPQWV